MGRYDIPYSEIEWTCWLCGGKLAEEDERNYHRCENCGALMGSRQLQELFDQIKAEHR